MKRPTRTAFGLIELVIVIAILLVLGSVVSVNFFGAAGKVERDMQRSQFDQIGAAMKQFQRDLKRYPSGEEGIEVLWNRDVLEEEDQAARWSGPYLEKPVTSDRWGGELVYTFPGEIIGESSYDLVSIGPDGEAGTDDDMTNHD